MRGFSRLQATSTPKVGGILKGRSGFSDGRDLSLVSSIGINNSFLGIFLGIFVFSLELNEKPLHFPISTNEQQMVPKIHPLPLASRADEDFLHEQTKKK